MNRNMHLKFGVVTNNDQDVFQRDILRGVSETAQKRGYQAMPLFVSDWQLPPKALDGLAGVVIIANCLTDETLRGIYKMGMPLSLVSHQISDLPIPVLSPDNFEGVQLLVEHLVVQCQRKRIVFIQGDLTQKDGIKRDAIFRREMMRYNLPVLPEFVLKGDFMPHIARESLAHLLSQRQDFDAVLASDYLMGLEALHVLYSANIAVPQQVCVVGFGDAPEAEQAGLTTVAADVIELGRRAARQLIGQIEGLLIRGTTLISAELIKRNTSELR
jgi:LacI family transcriptional regulator